MSVLAVVAVAGCGAQTETANSGSAPTARAVVAQLKRADLPIGKVEVYNERTDSNKLLGRPGQYTGKANFYVRDVERDGLDQSPDVSEGGSVEVFDDEEAAEKREEYVKAITESGGPFAEYSFRDGLVLLRLSHDLTPDQAEKFQDALP